MAVGAVDHRHRRAHVPGRLEDREPRRERTRGERVPQVVDPPRGPLGSALLAAVQAAAAAPDACHRRAAALVEPGRLRCRAPLPRPPVVEVAGSRRRVRGRRAACRASPAGCRAPGAPAPRAAPASESAPSSRTASPSPRSTCAPRGRRPHGGRYRGARGRSTRRAAAPWRRRSCTSGPCGPSSAATASTSAGVKGRISSVRG